jgi:hypothetical protein
MAATYDPYDTARPYGAFAAQPPVPGGFGRFNDPTPPGGWSDRATALGMPPVPTAFGRPPPVPGGVHGFNITTPPGGWANAPGSIAPPPASSITGGGAPVPGGVHGFNLPPGFNATVPTIAPPTGTGVTPGTAPVSVPGGAGVHGFNVAAPPGGWAAAAGALNPPPAAGTGVTPGTTPAVVPGGPGVHGFNITPPPGGWDASAGRRPTDTGFERYARSMATTPWTDLTPAQQAYFGSLDPAKVFAITAGPIASNQNAPGAVRNFMQNPSTFQRVYQAYLNQEAGNLGNPSQSFWEFSRQRDLGKDYFGLTPRERGSTVGGGGPVQGRFLRSFS